MNNYLLQYADDFIRRKVGGNYLPRGIAYQDETSTIFHYMDRKKQTGIYVRTEHDDEGNIRVDTVSCTDQGFMPCKLEDAEQASYFGDWKEEE